MCRGGRRRAGPKARLDRVERDGARAQGQATVVQHTAMHAAVLGIPDALVSSCALRHQQRRHCTNPRMIRIGPAPWSHLAPPSLPSTLPHQHSISQTSETYRLVAKTPEFRLSSHHHPEVHAETEPSFGHASAATRNTRGTIRPSRRSHGKTVQFIRKKESEGLTHIQLLSDFNMYIYL